MTKSPNIAVQTKVQDSKARRSDRRLVKNRKALLNAAAKLVAEKGFERLTIDEIAAAADLAKGTFYNYFDDKNQIAAELALTARYVLETEVTAAQVKIEDPAARLATGICVFLRKAVTAPAQASIVARMYSQWLTPEAAGNQQIRRDLKDGYRNKRFSSATMPAALLLTVGVVQAGITRALAISDHEEVRTLAAELCGMVLRGLGIKRREARSIADKTAARVFDEGSREDV